MPDGKPKPVIKRINSDEEETKEQEKIRLAKQRATRKRNKKNKERNV